MPKSKLPKIKLSKPVLLGVFVLLSAIDVIANGGSFIPLIGPAAETAQEVPNEFIQIVMYASALFVSFRKK